MSLTLKTERKMLSIAGRGARGPLGLEVATPVADRPGKLLQFAPGGTGNRAIAVVGATPANAVAATDLAAKTGADLVGVDLGATAIPASAKDALRWVTKAGLDTYGIGGSGFDVAAQKAWANGARYMRLPDGAFTQATLWTPPAGTDGFTLEGGCATTITCTQGGGAGGFRVAPIGGALTNAVYRGFNVHAATMGVAGLHLYFADMANVLCEDIAVTMAPGLDMNAVTLAISAGGDGAPTGVDGLTLRRLLGLSAGRIAFELLNQAITSRARPHGARILVEDCLAYAPGSTSYGYGFSVDGLFEGLELRRPWMRAVPGAGIELIEVNGALIDKPLFDAHTGRPFQLSNAGIKAGITIQGGRNINGDLAQDAYLASCEALRWIDMVLTFGAGAINVLSDNTGMSIEGGSTTATGSGCFAPLVVSGPGLTAIGHGLDARASSSGYCGVVTGAAALDAAFASCPLFRVAGADPWLTASGGGSAVGVANILRRTSAATTTGSGL